MAWIRALDGLQERSGPFTASAILALAWGMWHLPLFEMGQYHDRSGARPFLPLFLWNILTTTIVMTWLYNRTARSVFLMITYHFMTNLTGEILPRSPEVDMLYSAAMTTVAAGLAVGWLRSVVPRWPP